MKVLLAVSGGIDSMCMADLYSHTGDEYAVAHCNFHLRGEESDADAEFVEEWARARGARFFRADFDTARYASEHGISIEMAARELRYTWFARIAFEHGFEAVAVAHNANDNAETLILNLLRGTGLRGITGMAAESSLPGVQPPGNCLTAFGPSHCGQWAPPSYVAEGGTNFQGAALPERELKLIRPMLGMTREEIKEYAREHGVKYREDRTNADNGYKRNRIRNAVFPEFARINPSFVRTLNEDMGRFAQADAIVEDYFREAEAKVVSDGRISVPQLMGLKHWEYVLYRILEPCGFHPDTFGSIVRMLREQSGSGNSTFAGKRFFSPAHILETSSGFLTVRERQDAGSESGEVTVAGPGDYTFKGKTVRIGYAVPESLKQPAGLLICDAGSLPFPFVLRSWKDGDWMRPFGMGGRAKKLSDLFADRKMSLTDKEEAIVVYSPALDAAGDGRVAAVAGLRMDEALRVAKGSVKVLRIEVL